MTGKCVARGTAVSNLKTQAFLLVAHRIVYAPDSALSYPMRIHLKGYINYG